MLASIHPLGERARDNRFWLTAISFVTGAVIGGATVGALAGGLGVLLRTLVDLNAGAVGLAVAGLAAAGLAFDLRMGGLRLPTVRRQVNEDWLTTYRGWVYGAGFGVQLGLGVVTIVTTAAVYLAVAFAVLSGSVARGAVIGITFGLLRGLAILPVARVTDAACLRRFHRRFDHRARLVTVLSAAAQGALALVALALTLAR